MHKFAKLLCKCFLTLNIFSCPITADSVLDEYIIPITLEHENSGIPLIDCIYVINSEKKPEKWVKCRDEFLEYSIYPNRVNAFDGWKLTEKQLQGLVRGHPIRINCGQIGSLISRLSILKDAYQRGFECIWVCEDDVIFLQDPHLLADHIIELSKVQPNWDILYTDIDSKDRNNKSAYSLPSDFRPDFPYDHLCHYIQTFNYLQKESINKDIVKIKQRVGAYSMIISRNGIQKILNHFENISVWAAFDIEIHYISGVEEFSLKNEIVTSKWSVYSEKGDMDAR